MICSMLSTACSPKDTTPPEFELYEDEITLTSNTTFNPLRYVSASDDIDGDLTDSIQVISNNVDTDQPGNYVVTYFIENASGLSATASIEFFVAEEFTKEEEAAIAVINALKKVLINPSSLTINSIYVTEELGVGSSNYVVELDTTAETEAGGSSRDVYYVVVDGETMTCETSQVSDDPFDIYNLTMADTAFEFASKINTVVEIDIDKVYSN